MNYSKRTKIIASISDIAYDEARIVGLYNAWVNVLRFNFSHAWQSEVAKIVTLVRELNASGKTNLSMLLDTKWPEIRTGSVEEKIQVAIWDKIKIFVDQSLLTQPNDLFCDYPHLLEDLVLGQTLILDSWLLTAKVVELTPTYALLEMLNNHLIGSRRHINLPGVKLKLPGLTEKDMSDVQFAIDQKIDFIAASFIRSKANVDEIKDILKKNNAQHIQIISKIENQEALENLDEIVQASDGVMVARGDLGVEVPISKLPFYQKEIMDACFTYGKTIVIATELLKSMVESPFPTRAEVSDVYNCVMMRTDVTMLSDETAAGKFPIQSAQMMSDVLAEAESHTNNKHKDFDITFVDNYPYDDKMVAKSALYFADEIKADFLLIFSKTGTLARIVSAFKPNQPVFAFTKDEHVLRTMNILFAIHPFLESDWSEEEPVKNENLAIDILREKWLIKKWQKIVIINHIIQEWCRSPYLKLVTL